MSSGLFAVVVGPGGADAEAEAFFAHEGGAAVDDGGGLVLGAVPVEGRSEIFGGRLAVAGEVVNGAGGDGEVGGFGTEIAVGGVAEGPTGDGDGFAGDGGDEGGGDGCCILDCITPFRAALAFFAGRTMFEHDFVVLWTNPSWEPAAGVLGDTFFWFGIEMREDGGGKERPFDEPGVFYFLKAG